MTFIARERLMPHVGNIIALVGLDVLAYGLIKLSVWAAVVGNIVTIGKKIFLDEPSIYTAHKNDDPVWAGRLYWPDTVQVYQDENGI